MDCKSHLILIEKLTNELRSLKMWNKFYQERIRRLEEEKNGTRSYTE